MKQCPYSFGVVCQLIGRIRFEISKKISLNSIVIELYRKGFKYRNWYIKIDDSRPLIHAIS